MSMQSLMVMPPIYCFPDLDDPEARAWGWHRATDLVEVVNNIRDLRDEQKLTAEEIGLEYDIVDPDYFRIVCESSYVDKDARVGGLSPAPHAWLKDAVYYARCFVPAKLGMILIDQVKNPNRTFYKKVRRAMEGFIH